ncbi:hypothetical protein, partial [Anaerotruncus colihominis]
GGVLLPQAAADNKTTKADKSDIILTCFMIFLSFSTSFFYQGTLLTRHNDAHLSPCKFILSSLPSSCLCAGSHKTT